MSGQIELSNLLRQAAEAHDDGDNPALARFMASASTRVFELGLQAALGEAWQAEIERGRSAGDFAPIILAVNSLGCVLFPVERKGVLHQILACLSKTIRAIEEGAERRSEDTQRLLLDLKIARDQLLDLISFMDQTMHPHSRAGAIQ